MSRPEDISAARWDRGAETRFMAEASGYVMVRRPGCMPYVLSRKEWLKLPLAALGREMAARYDEAARSTGKVE